jgi:hypothetical protein
MTPSYDEALGRKHVRVAARAMEAAGYEASRRKYIFCVVMLGAANDDVASTDLIDPWTLRTNDDEQRNR